MRPVAWALLVVGAVSLSAVAPIAVDLSGRWAMVQVYPEIATLPIVGETLRTSIVAQLVDVVQTDSAVFMRDTYCFTLVGSGTALLRTEVPERFMAALRPSPRTAHLSVSSTGVRFTQDEYVEVRGACLADSSLDALPTSPDDPRVFDQDADGFPGMSVRVRILGFLDGTAYVIQRVRYSLDGVVTAAGTVRGTIRWATEQTTLGASTALLRTNAPAHPHPDPSRSAFLMARVDSSNGCDVLRQRLSEWLDVLGVPLP
ncbi:MAG: hypothetical protein PHU43_09200 [Candidatus Bipolaricaulis sp.]|nr:hypothetical protein [Candidatus Bipolaricaulis sp.]